MHYLKQLNKQEFKQLKSFITSKEVKENLKKYFCVEEVGEKGYRGWMPEAYWERPTIYLFSTKKGLLVRFGRVDNKFTIYGIVEKDKTIISKLITLCRKQTSSDWELFQDFTLSLDYLYELDLPYFQKRILINYITPLLFQVKTEFKEEIIKVKKEKIEAGRQKEEIERKAHFDSIKNYEDKFNQIEVKKTILGKIKDRISKPKKDPKKRGLLSIFELDVLEGGLSKVPGKENGELA